MKVFVYYIFVLTWRSSWSIQNEMASEGRLSEDGIVFPELLPERRQEVPLDLIRRINEAQVRNIDDFIDNFVETGSLTNATDIMSRIGGDDIERNAIKRAKMAECIPEPKTVSLSPENDKSVFYYPSCTRIERCGGCCGHALLSCQPLESEIIKFSVVVAEYRGGSQLKFKRREVIGVEQHKRCKCDCKVQPEDCTKYQKYHKEKCSCECGNTDEEKKCHSDRRNKVWNKDVCSCMCREELVCGTGFYFDPFNCRCEQIPGRRRYLKQKLRPWNGFDYKKEFQVEEDGGSTLLFRQS